MVSDTQNTTHRSPLKYPLRLLHATSTPQALPSRVAGKGKPFTSGAEENNVGHTVFPGADLFGKRCTQKEFGQKHMLVGKKNVAETQEMDFLSSGSFVFWQTCRKCKERTLKLVIGYFGGEKIR